MEATPLALYVHMPWCVRKCPYCDFNSHAVQDAVPERAYVDALLADLSDDLPSVWGRSLTSVFIGGGTPSLFSGAAVDRLLSGIRALMPLPPGSEITLEANPGTLEARRFEQYRAAGVNRLSIGVQSFNDGHLRAIGRIHDAGEAEAAVAAALAAGFQSVNLDLMYGLPGQSVAEARADTERAATLPVGHISHYQLTLEPNTPFSALPPVLPHERVIEAQLAACRTVLVNRGFQRYEVSAYARAGQRCAHNLNYWEFGDYLGIGAGAHGKVTERGGGVERTAKHRGPKDYLARRNRSYRSSTRRLDAADLVLEFMMNALRLVDGVPTRLFFERTGLPLKTIRGAMGRARAAGLLLPEDRIQATGRGQRFLNDLLAYFNDPGS